MPNTQAFVEALSKLGLNILPYLKYVAFAVVGFYGLVFVLVLGVFAAVGYQFLKAIDNFGRNI